MIDDETLMAYADGELDTLQRSEVEKAAASDPATAKRLMDHVALRHRMAGAFADVLDEPVPPRLRALAGGAGQSTGTLIDLTAARASRARTSKPPWRIGGAMAACLAVGLLVGVGLETVQPPPMISGRDGAMVADGGLATALSTQLVANQTGAEPIKIGLSFRTAKGEYCRTFSVDRDASMAGVACRNRAAWSIKMAIATGSIQTSNGYRTASSRTPPPIAQYVETFGAVEALDAKGEAQAKAQGWLGK
jgi:hypothetical protein